MKVSAQKVKFRFCLWTGKISGKQSRDELKLLENKRLTLEVQFYNEVKKMALHYEKFIFMKGILKYSRRIVSLAQLTLSQSNDNYFAICILLEILEGLDY